LNQNKQTDILRPFFREAILMKQMTPMVEEDYSSADLKQTASHSTRMVVAGIGNQASF